MSDYRLPTAQPLSSEQLRRRNDEMKSGKRASMGDECPTALAEKNLPELKLLRCSDVEPKQINWLWKNRIPRGKPSLICGNPGEGKSLFTSADMASRVSRGMDWPDGAPGGDPGSVIIFSAEDDPEDTIRPRLDRANADVSRIYIMESVTFIDPTSGERRHNPFCLGEHVPLLQQAVERIGDVALIVIDPVSSYGGKVDSHKNADVRTMLSPLSKLAQDFDIAVVMVTHLSKGAGGKAVYRATGSLAYAAAARAVWMVARDFEQPKRRLLLPVKINITAELSGMAFSVQGDIGGPYLTWEADPVAMTADGYLSAEAKHLDSKSDDDSALTEAVEFLKDQLKDGPMLSKELTEAARANDIKPKTLERARRQLGCKANKRSDGKWETTLPGKNANPSVTRNHDVVGVLGVVGDAFDEWDMDPKGSQERQDRQESGDRERDVVPF